MKCSNCNIDLEDWIYYEHGKITICHFCYKMLNKKNDGD